MAHFVIVTGNSGFEHINIDQVRRVVEDMDGNVTLHFDATHQIKLSGQNARKIVEAVNNLWSRNADQPSYAR